MKIGFPFWYFFYITLGLPFYMFGQAMNPVIRSDGSPRFAMVFTLAGAAANIILDPVCIFLFHWGMMGAAVATVSGQVLTAALAVWYLPRMRATKLRKDSFRLNGNVIRKFIPLGICGFLSQISLVASMAAVNNMIREYGTRDEKTGQETFTFLLTVETMAGVTALLIAEVFPGTLVSIFGAANESACYTEFALKAFRVYLCMMIPACISKATFIYLQALGKAFLSTALSTVREMLFGVGFALLLPAFFRLDGVLFSMPVSDALTFVISVAAIISTYRTLRTPDSAPRPAHSAA